MSPYRIRAEHEAERQHAGLYVVHRAELGDRRPQRHNRITDLPFYGTSVTLLLAVLDSRCFKRDQRRATRLERGFEVTERWLDIPMLHHHPD